MFRLLSYYILEVPYLRYQIHSLCCKVKLRLDKVRCVQRSTVPSAKDRAPSVLHALTPEFFCPRTLNPKCYLPLKSSVDPSGPPKKSLRKDPRQAEQEFFDAVDFFAAGLKAPKWMLYTYIYIYMDTYTIFIFMQYTHIYI